MNASSPLNETVINVVTVVLELCHNMYAISCGIEHGAAVTIVTWHGVMSARGVYVRRIRMKLSIYAELANQIEVGE